MKNLTIGQMAAAKFKEQCLLLLDTVSGAGIVITKHGKPVAKLVPFHTDSNLIGSLAGKVKIARNILSTRTKRDAQR